MTISPALQCMSLTLRWKTDGWLHILENRCCSDCRYITTAVKPLSRDPVHFSSQPPPTHIYAHTPSSILTKHTSWPWNLGYVNDFRAIYESVFQRGISTLSSCSSIKRNWFFPGLNQIQALHYISITLENQFRFLCLSKTHLCLHGIEIFMNGSCPVVEKYYITGAEMLM